MATEAQNVDLLILNRQTCLRWMFSFHWHKPPEFISWRWIYPPQVVLIISGNLSFLNWLTIVPSLACFDDASLGFLFSSRGGAKKAALEIQREDAAGQTNQPTKGSQPTVAELVMTQTTGDCVVLKIVRLPLFFWFLFCSFYYSCLLSPFILSVLKYQSNFLSKWLNNF